MIQFVAVVLLEISTPKEFYMKLVDQLLDHEIYSILEYAEVLYHTVIYRAIT
jgi:hypothetical protein